MKLIAIVAHDPLLLIGRKGELPWHYPNDLKFFKQQTLGHALLMGRKVFESLKCKPLSNRENLVLSRTTTYNNVLTFSSIERALEYGKKYEKLYVIGGREIYQQLLPLCHQLIVTLIPRIYTGDTYFIEYRHDIGTTWQLTKHHSDGELEFLRYERMKI